MKRILTLGSILMWVVVSSVAQEQIKISLEQIIPKTEHKALGLEKLSPVEQQLLADKIIAVVQRVLKANQEKPKTAARQANDHTPKRLRQSALALVREDKQA